MSIYNTDRYTLPQVKIMRQDKLRLAAFLDIFGRSYADFVRDLCDANIKWHTQDISHTFDDHARGVAHLVTKRYMEINYEHFKNKSYKTVPEQLQAHLYPYPHKVHRLPTVVVSRWQADNLHEFLAKYARSYADFIRAVARQTFICPIDAQAEVPQFYLQIQRVFNLAFDEMVGAKKMMDSLQYKRQWPVDQNRHAAVKSKNQRMG